MNIYMRTINTCLLCMLPCFAIANPNTNKACDELADLTIIGEVEHVSILPHNLKLKARIDTGAKGSSLSAADILQFERDGKKWIRFSIKHPDTKKTIEIESPLIRTVEIKRHDTDAQKRPVVKLSIRIGDKTFKSDFSLTDRSQFEYPILIGRNLLSNRFIVDVNRRFTDEEKETIEE
jgi:hypothetical protein